MSVGFCLCGNVVVNMYSSEVERSLAHQRHPCTMEESTCLQLAPLCLRPIGVPARIRIGLELYSAERPRHDAASVLHVAGSTIRCISSFMQLGEDVQGRSRGNTTMAKDVGELRVQRGRVHSSKKTQRRLPWLARLRSLPWWIFDAAPELGPTLPNALRLGLKSHRYRGRPCSPSGRRALCEMACCASRRLDCVSKKSFAHHLGERQPAARVLSSCHPRPLQSVVCSEMSNLPRCVSSDQRPRSCLPVGPASRDSIKQNSEPGCLPTSRQRRSSASSVARSPSSRTSAVPRPVRR